MACFYVRPGTPQRSGRSSQREGRSISSCFRARSLLVVAFFCRDACFRTRFVLAQFFLTDVSRITFLRTESVRLRAVGLVAKRHKLLTGSWLAVTALFVNIVGVVYERLYGTRIAIFVPCLPHFPICTPPFRTTALKCVTRYATRT